jgi:hypothetical protein
MASTGLGADEAPMDRYPVDGIKDKTPCELHQSMKNISMKMAISYALSCEPGVTWHSHQIPVGYARVGVDEIVPGYESLDLDMPGPEDEATLGSQGWCYSMEQERHQVSRLGATATESSQVTITSKSTP